MRFLSLAFILFSLGAPSLVIASICIELPNKIYHDLNKYSDAIYQQKLPWMKLSWLEKKNGKTSN